MKKKKRIIALVIAVAVTIAVAIPTAILVPKYIDENQLDMAIISDTHVLSQEQMGTGLTVSLTEQEARGQKMLVLSEALLSEGIDMVIAEKQEILLLAGDLTDDGGKSSHQAVARQLKRAEEKGVACFVINGNHDINNHAKSYKENTPTKVDNVNAEQFAEIYDDFGYGEALDRHSDSLSYTAELNKEYRLLAIDCCFYEINTEEGYVEGRHDSVTSDSLIQWIESSLEKAKKDGKRTLAMMHFPVASHLTNLIDNNSTTVDRKDEISNLFLHYNVQYVFTGHLHSQDIAAVENKEGKTLYDVETASLCNYPMPIRFFKGKPKKELLSTKYLTSLKEKYIPKLIPTQIKTEILKDLTAYSERIVNDGMKAKVMNKLDTDTILALLGAFNLDIEATKTVELGEDIRNNLILDFFNTPLYKNGTNKSVQDICEEFSITLPASDYTTVWSVVVKFLTANYRGNEGYRATDIEGVLLKYSLYTAFYKIAEYDFFGKLNELNSNVLEVDLMPSMESLFKEGHLDLEDNQFLGILSSIKVITDFQERWSDKFLIGNLISNIDLSNPRSTLDFVGALLSLMAEYDMKLSSFIGENSSIGAIIDGLPISDIINHDQGYLDINCVYDLLFGELGANLITDQPPADDALMVKKTKKKG